MSNKLKFNKFNLESKADVKLTYGKSKSRIEEVIMTSTEKDGATKNHIIDTIKKIQKIAIDKGSDYKMMIALKYDGGWRSGQMFNLTEMPLLFDIGDYVDNTGQNRKKNINLNQTKFREFCIYKIPIIKTGGCIKQNSKNDCLFYCIREALGIDNLNLKYNTARKFKNCLRLNREDKIHISKIPEIEEMIKANINVSGDVLKLSQNKFPRMMKIILTDEHYVIDNLKIKNCLVKPTNKNVAFFRTKTEKNTNNKQIEIYSKDINIQLLYTEGVFKKVQEDYKLYLIKDKNIENDIEDSYNEYLTSAENLYKKTNGFIDLYKYPEVSKMALYLFHCLSKGLKEPSQIGSLESFFLTSSFKGALIYSNDGVYNNAVSIDQNSQYSYYLSHPNFLVAISEGEIQYITKEDFEKYDFFPYGIYNCIVESTNNEYNKFFRFNNKNYYTHYDLTLAKLLKFKITIIDNNGSNCIVYDKNKRIQASKMYGSTIKYLYKIKQETKDVYVKKIISSLWGAHCKKIKNKTYYKYGEEMNIDENILDIHKNEKGLKIITNKHENVFSNNYARVGTFLTSYCRLQMVKMMLKHFKIENIIRIHTDSCTIINQEIPKVLLGTNIGYFKIEKNGQCNIKNVNNVIWN